MRKINKGLAYLLAACLCMSSVSYSAFASEPDAGTVQKELKEMEEAGQAGENGEEGSRDADPAQGADPSAQDSGQAKEPDSQEEDGSGQKEPETGAEGTEENAVTDDDPGKGRLQGNIPEEFFGPATFSARATGIQHDSRFGTGYTIQDGIDVSEWNGNINWTKVKNAGIDFAFIRVAWRGYGGGTLNVDNTAYTNLKGAIAAGIPVGVYVFSQAISTAEAKEEANYIIDKIKGYNVTLPVILDFEFASENGKNAGRLYEKFKNKDKAAATKVCMAFCQQVAARGYTPMVYGNPDMFYNYLNPGTISASYPIWLAHYTSKTDYTGDYNYWQYSSTGKVSGITGNVDLNVGYIKNGGANAVPPVASLDTPVLASASNSAKGVTVKWNAVNNATGYYVYRKTVDESWVRIAETSSGSVLEYVDTKAASGVDYIYTVRAENRGVLSGYDKEGVRVHYLKTPSLKSAQGSPTEVKVTWEQVPEADGYYFYRKASGGTWERMEELSDNSTVTYSDKSGEEGELYYYTVRAYKYIGEEEIKSWYLSPGVSGVKADYEDYKTTAAVNYRSGAGTSYSVKGTLAEGKTVSVVKNYSQKANNYTWYRFALDSQIYYIASEYLKKATASTEPKPTPTPTPAPAPKPTPAPTYVKYKTTAKVNYRSGAGTSYAVKGTLAKGKSINVEKGYSKKKNGYTWYRFKKGSKTYYIASKYVKKAGPVYVKYKTKTSVNYRKGPGTSYAVKGTLAKGKKINVEKGYSKKKNGYTWYRFKKGTKMYYIASKYVKKV